MISPSVALALWLAVWGLQPSQPPPPTPAVAAQEKQQLSNGKADDRQNIQLQPKSSQIVNENASSEDQSAKRDKKSSPDWITWFTGIIATGAILQFVVLIIQARFMHLTRKSFEIGERARVFLDCFQFRGIGDAASNEVLVSYQVRNTGRTPAMIYEQTCTVSDRDGPLPKDPPYEGEGKPADYTVGAGVNYELLAKVPKKELPNIAKVAIGKAALYVFGYVRYRDAFGSNQITRYGVKYELSGRATAITEMPGYNTAT